MHRFDAEDLFHDQIPSLVSEDYVNAFVPYRDELSYEDSLRLAEDRDEEAALNLQEDYNAQNQNNCTVQA